MATMTLNITAGATVYNFPKTVSGTDLNRFLAAYRAKYGQTTNGGVPRDRTDAEVAQMWANEVYDELLAYTQRYETEQFRKTNVPIALT